MYLLFLWFAVGVGAALIAMARGVRGIQWYLLAVLLGPFGTLVGMFSTRRCPNCEARYPRNVKSCPYCEEAK